MFIPQLNLKLPLFVGVNLITSSGFDDSFETPKSFILNPRKHPLTVLSNVISTGIPDFTYIVLGS